MPALRSLLGSLIAGLLLFVPAPAASAARGQVAMFQDDLQVSASPDQTLATLRSLGVGVLRYTVNWSQIAVGPRAGSRAVDPAAPEYNWTTLDAVVRAAAANRITVDLSLTGGAPRWAIGARDPSVSAGWRPNAVAFGDFVQAVGTRYSGHDAGLPRIAMWEIWNEPNFGPDLAPQATNGSRDPAAAPAYRRLIDMAWRALQATHHGRDTIILGNLDARGQSAVGRPGTSGGLPGNFGATKPLLFVRQLYCVDARLRSLRGSAARLLGCPTGAGAVRRFRSAHPALFQASGFGDHPYPLTAPPNRVDSDDPDYAELAQLPHLIATLDAIQRTYGLRHHFAIYDNEYGYITNPPNRSQHFPSPALAAAYINWAEYLSWLNPRLASTMQFLLEDPDPRHAPEYGGFASGLEFYGGRHKPTYDAYILPVFVPTATVRRGRRTLVWGCARPAHVFGRAGVRIEFQTRAQGAWALLRTVSASGARGCFEAAVRLPGRGRLRLAWSYPQGRTVHSRVVAVTVS